MTAHFKSRPILAILIAAFLISLFPCFASELDEPWSTDLMTLEGQLTVTQAILHRHPGLLIKGLQSRTAPLQHLSWAREVLEHIGPHGATQDMIAGARWAGSIGAFLNLVYDHDAIHKFKQGIENDSQTLLFEPQDTLELTLSTVPPEFFLPFLKTVPLLFNDEGQLIRQEGHATVADYVKNFTQSGIWNNSGELESLYKDRFPIHLKPMIIKFLEQMGSAALHQKFQSFDKKFLRKEVQRAFALKTKEQGVSTKRRHITIEEVPPLVALFRGAVGSDCSTTTAAQYALVKGVRTYFIRKGEGFDADPEGYALVVPVSHRGKIIPYVITINGPTLGNADARLALHLIAKDWGTDHVIVPDFDKNSSTVNTQLIKHGMQLDHSEAIVIELPVGWEEVTKWRKSQKYPYNNYAANSLKNARLAPLNFSQIFTKPHQTEVAYPQGIDIKSNPTLERAVLAAMSIPESEKEMELKNKILLLLNINEEELNAGKLLANVMPWNPLDLQKFKTLSRVFGFKEKDIAILDILTRAHSLARLYHEGKEELDLSMLEKLIRKTNDDLEHNMVGLDEEGEDAFYFALKARLVLPVLDSTHSAWDLLPDLLKRDYDPKRRDHLVEILQDIKQWPESFWKQFYDLLKNSNSKQRQRMLLCLRKKDNIPEFMWKELANLLEDPSLEMHESVASTLGTISHWPSVVWEKLPKFLEENKDIGTDGAPQEYSIAYTLVRSADGQTWPESFWRALAHLLEEDGRVFPKKRKIQFTNPFEEMIARIKDAELSPKNLSIWILYGIGQQKYIPDFVLLEIEKLFQNQRFLKDPNQCLQHAIKNLENLSIPMWHAIKAYLNEKPRFSDERERETWVDHLKTHRLVPPQDELDGWIALMQTQIADSNNAVSLQRSDQEYLDFLLEAKAKNPSLATSCEQKLRLKPLRR